MFNAKQTEFEILSTNLKKDFDRFEKSKAKKTLEFQKFDTDLKRLLKLLSEISSNTKHPPAKVKQSKERLKKFTTKYNDLKEQLKHLKDLKAEVEKEELFKGRGDGTEMKPMTMTAQAADEEMNNGIGDNLGIVKNLEKDAEEVDEIHNDMLLDLDDQGKVLKKAQEDTDAIADEAGTVARIFKTVKNKNLLNKVILLSLAVFLTFADIVLLALKI